MFDNNSNNNNKAGKGNNNNENHNTNMILIILVGTSNPRGRSSGQVYSLLLNLEVQFNSSWDLTSNMLEFPVAKDCRI